MKTIKVIILVGVLGGGLLVGWHYRFAYQALSKKLPDIASSPFIQTIKDDISAPSPLRGNFNAPSARMTLAGTISWTNINRQQNGNLKPLKENSKLDAAAELKLQDMFKQQYFEHINPQGIGPGDLARQVRYSYLSEGENLALGNFTDDKALLEAWMNSPGHRANILNTKYSEIGVAVGKGTYEGKTVWLAVQEFGRPASECPGVSEGLKVEISSLKDQVAAEESIVKKEKEDLDNTPAPTSKEEADAYNTKVNAYNAQVKDYNEKLETIKQVIASYNAQVNAYNSCLEK